MKTVDWVTERIWRRVDTPLKRHAEPVRDKRDGVSAIWIRTLVSLFVVVLGLGALAFGSTAYQRSAFDRTTAELESELDAVVHLADRIRPVDTPMAAILYGFGTRAELEGHVRAFLAHRREIDAAFDHAEQFFAASDTNDPLASARAGWNKAADGALAAQEFWGTSAVADALASGEDPFADEWELLKNAQADVTRLTGQSLAHLRARTAGVEQVQQLIPAAVLSALALVLLLGLWSADRLSRRVVAPVMELRNAAVRMRDGDLNTAVHVDGAGAELKDLARAMNELAASLDTSHRLLRTQACTDTLTGLPNRQAMSEHLTGRLAAAPAAGTSLLFIDLDDFKFINDTMGHEAGDQVLTIVAARLCSSVRDSDLVARLGGDEFAVALDEGHHPAPAVMVAERILAAFDMPVMIKGAPVSLSCSIGIALTGAESVTAEDLLREADMAMYVAKSSGKNRLELHSHTMHTEMVARMNLKADLTHAAGRDELVLHYQPVIDLSTDDILGWEALVRWQHPDRGLLPPGDFIPMAEESGDILAIGRWVLDRACADFARTLAPGRTDRWLSVNVSARQLLASDLAEAVKQSLDRCGMDPGSLILEITEAALVSDIDEAAPVLASLKRHGVQVAIDDFGTGFSSLRRLQALPIDIIKIDRCFVSGAGTPQSASMLEAIVTLGNRLGLDIIAEGIEHESELECLKRLGNVAGQGYYLARPMPLDQAREHARPAVQPGTQGDPRKDASLTKDAGSGLPALG